MFDYLKTLVMINIQSHKQTVLHFNKTGLHRIKAPPPGNSHGKSAIFKALNALFLAEGIDKSGRNSLISWDSVMGAIQATSYNGITLTLFLHLESSKCYYELEYNNQKIRKSLSDNYKELIKVGNFHYFPEYRFSLNRYKTKTTLPFTHTSPILNYKILDSASEVPEAKRALTLIEDNLQEIKNDRNRIERRIEALTEQVNLIGDDNIEKLEKRLNMLTTVYNRYKTIKPLLQALTEIAQTEQRISVLQLQDYRETEPLLKTLNIIKDMQDKLKYVKTCEQAIVKLEETRPAKPIKVTGILEELNTLTEMRKHHRNAINSTKALQGITEQQYVDTNGALESLKVIRHLTKQTSQIKKLIEVIDNLEVSKPINIITYINVMVIVTTLKTNLEQVIECTEVSERIKPKEITPVENLVEEIVKLNYLTETFKLITKETRLYEDITEKVQILDNELVSINKQIGVCTNCGEPLKDDRHRWTI